MAASLLTLYSGDKSAYQVAQYQPMKLAAMEALYEGGTRQPLTVVGEWKIPTMLSFLATRNPDGYVPGIHNILAGGYTTNDGSKALSATEKIAKGKMAIAALSDFRQAQKDGEQDKMDASRRTLEENMPYFGYGYIQNPDDLVPNVGLSFWNIPDYGRFRDVFPCFFRLGLFSCHGKINCTDKDGCTESPYGAFLAPS